MWENAYLSIKNPKASRALKRALDPGCKLLTWLMWLHFTTSATFSLRTWAPLDQILDPHLAIQNGLQRPFYTAAGSPVALWIALLYEVQWRIHDFQDGDANTKGVICSWKLHEFEKQIEPGGGGVAWMGQCYVTIHRMSFIAKYEESKKWVNLTFLCYLLFTSHSVHIWPRSASNILFLHAVE